MTNCLHPFTSCRLQISTPMCFITSEGTGTYYNFGETKFCIFLYFWHSLHLFTYSPTSVSILSQHNLFAHFWYVESLPRCDAIILDLQLSPIPSWMSWIICWLSFLDLIISLLFQGNSLSLVFTNSLLICNDN